MINKINIKKRNKFKDKYAKLSHYDAQLIARRVKKLTGIDVFEKTRKQENVYTRSVFNHCLKQSFGWGLTKIAKLYIDNGYKTYDHATVWHSLQMFDLYVQYEPKLMDLYERISDNQKSKNSQIVLIGSKLKALHPEQLVAINTLADTFFKENAE